MSNKMEDNWMNEEVIEENVQEGQLALDVYQTEDDVIIKAPLAGVEPDDLEIGLTDDVVTIKGHRKDREVVSSENYFAQECYWGQFSRTYLLPIKVDSDEGKAEIKNGILIITLPKLEKTKTRYIKVS